MAVIVEGAPAQIIHPGQRVRHVQFGEGVVVSVAFDG